MRIERVKKFLKMNAVRILCAGMIMTGVAVAVIPNSYAAVTQREMNVEVAMYDPSDKSIFLVKDRNTADYCEKTMGYKRVLFSSLNTRVPVFMTQRMTADQAKYKAKFVYMAAGYDEATAVALVNAIADCYEASPDNWWDIAFHDVYVYLHGPLVQLEQAEAIEKQLTGTVMMGTHQGVDGHENDDAAANSTTTSAASNKKAGSAAEEVNQLYASLVASGKTSDQAMAEVNAQLASIIAKYA